MSDRNPTPKPGDMRQYLDNAGWIDRFGAYFDTFTERIEVRTEVSALLSETVQRRLSEGTLGDGLFDRVQRFQDWLVAEQGEDLERFRAQLAEAESMVRKTVR